MSAESDVDSQPLTLFIRWSRQSVLIIDLECLGFDLIHRQNPGIAPHFHEAHAGQRLFSLFVCCVLECLLVCVPEMEAVDEDEFLVFSDDSVEWSVECLLVPCFEDSSVLLDVKPVESRPCASAVLCPTNLERNVLVDRIECNIL